MPVNSKKMYPNYEFKDVINSTLKGIIIVGLFLATILVSSLIIAPKAEKYYQSENSECLIKNETTHTNWCSEYECECGITPILPTCASFRANPENGTCIGEPCCVSTTSCGKNSRCCDTFGTDTCEYTFKECWEFTLIVAIANKTYTYVSNCGYGDYGCFIEFEKTYRVNQTLNCWLYKGEVLFDEPKDVNAGFYVLVSVTFIGACFVLFSLDRDCKRYEWCCYSKLSFDETHRVVSVPIPSDSLNKNQQNAIAKRITDYKTSHPNY